jgi:hypothetical protein
MLLSAEMARLAKEMAFQEDKETSNLSNSGQQEALDAIEASKLKLKTVPHLTNLNQDPSLDRVVKHFLESDTSRVGKAVDDSATGPEIPLGGLSIRKEHATIQKDGESFVLSPSSEIAETKVSD